MLFWTAGDTSPLWRHGGKAGKVLHFAHLLHRGTCRKSGVMPPQSKKPNPASPAFKHIRNSVGRATDWIVGSLDRWIFGWLDRWIFGWLDRWIFGWLPPTGSGVIHPTNDPFSPLLHAQHTMNLWRLGIKPGRINYSSRNSA